jgi:hypothetical protein
MNCEQVLACLERGEVIRQDRATGFFYVGDAIRFRTIVSNDLWMAMLLEGKIVIRLNGLGQRQIMLPKDITDR